MNILKRTPPRLLTSSDARTCCPRYRFDRLFAALSACLAALRPSAFHSAISFLCSLAAASAACAVLSAAASLPLSSASSSAIRLCRKSSSALGSRACQGDRSLSCRLTDAPPPGPAATLSLARTYEDSEGAVRDE